ncbi:hypothetical protein KUCAC02_025067, partial [Chaenocephalus aceratus]
MAKKCATHVTVDNKANREDMKAKGTRLPSLTKGWFDRPRAGLREEAPYGHRMLGGGGGAEQRSCT